jgi:hypothetical protein
MVDRGNINYRSVQIKPVFIMQLKLNRQHTEIFLRIGEMEITEDTLL